MVTLVLSLSLTVMAESIPEGPYPREAGQETVSRKLKAAELKPIPPGYKRPPLTKVDDRPGVKVIRGDDPYVLPRTRRQRQFKPHMWLELPNEEDKLYVNGQLFSEKGQQRKFEIPGVANAQRYSYLVKVVSQDEKLSIITRVYFNPGEHLVIKLNSWTSPMQVFTSQEPPTWASKELAAK